MSLLVNLASTASACAGVALARILNLLRSGAQLLTTYNVLPMTRLPTRLPSILMRLTTLSGTLAVLVPAAVVATKSTPTSIKPVIGAIDKAAGVVLGAVAWETGAPVVNVSMGLDVVMGVNVVG